MTLSVDVLVALLVGLIAGGLLGALVGWAVRRPSAPEAPLLADLDALLQPVRESLAGLQATTEASRRDRSVADAQITAQMHAVQDSYRSIGSATEQLSRALARGQTRGQWGEVQLESLLSHAGLVEGVHVRRQESRVVDGSGQRPDITVVMPDGGEILVDAKFPFDAYWQAMGAAEGAERDALLRKHAADVGARARELTDRRYADSGRGPDFVVMFLPLESLLSAAVEADGTLLERTFERRVVLATPTTMLALLRTVAFGYQRQRMAENAEEIKRTGAEMLTRLGVLVEHLDGLRRGLESAVTGYNRFVGSFDSQAMRQARRMHDLGVVASRPLDAPGSIDVGLRASAPAALRE